jgi:hypothetical protein
VGVTYRTHGVHVPDTDRWSDGAMTASPALRPVPDDVHVVEVYGSKFLLEWLDWDVLAAAAQHRAERAPTAPAPKGQAA